MRFVSHRVAVMYLGTIVEEAPAEVLFAQPLHPYSLGLLASVLLPDPDLKRANTIRLEGEIPSPIDLPPGCPLAGRCPFAEPRCHAERPPPLTVAPHHVGQLLSPRQGGGTRPDDRQFRPLPGGIDKAPERGRGV